MTLRLARIGWSNLWRNPRRTAITALGLAVGLVMLAFTVSLMAGTRRDVIERGTRLLLGHLQVHARGYRPDRSIFDTLPGDGRALAEALHARPEVRGAAPRAAGYGLISAGQSSAGADLLGVVPQLEAEVSTLHDHLVAGQPLGPAAAGEILIGEPLARTLDAPPGKELVVLTQAADGSLGNDVYRVAGVFRTGIEGIDGGLVVMHLDDLQALLALPPERVHEIAVRTADPESAPAVAAGLAADLESGAIGAGLRPAPTVAAWPELAPEIAGFASMADGWMWVMYAIVFALAAIGVLNTMLMAVFERLREFGVLGAIGMRPSQVVWLVVVEVGGLALVSLALGVALGTPLLYWLITSGIDLRSVTRGFTMSGVALEPVMRGLWTPRAFAESALGLLAFALAAGLYPALRAARVNPAALTRGEAL